MHTFSIYLHCYMRSTSSDMSIRLCSATASCRHVMLLQVRCIVRPRQTPADFLRDWGASTVQADLGDPTSLPAALVGVHTIIDCATARPEEPTTRVDWDGKKALIQCAQVRHTYQNLSTM